MTTCKYCGGEHNREHCPNCGAPSHHLVNAYTATRQFKLQMASAMGIPAHLFRADPVVRRAVMLASSSPRSSSPFSVEMIGFGQDTKS